MSDGPEDGLKVGDRAETHRVFDAEAVTAYLDLAGRPDDGAEAVPEPLIGGMFSYLLGAELPGYGTNYLKQTLDFVADAPVGERLSASVAVTRIRPEKELVDLATTCRDSRGRLVCEGRALVLVKDVGRRPADGAAAGASADRRDTDDRDNDNNANHA